MEGLDKHIVSRKNKSSVFLIPMLGGTQKLFFYNSLFLDAYCYKEGYGECLILKYIDSEDQLFEKFKLAVQKFRMYLSTFYDDDYVYFMFDIPRKYISDYNLFMKGKYSEFSIELKDSILRFHSETLTHREYVSEVLYKSEDRKQDIEDFLDEELPPNSELESKPNLEKESI
tara:strand:- start:68 stop:583 length:516 start_codon:yes stop_codon:yes gene_type:complete